MKNKLIASAGSKEELEKLINEFYFSKEMHYIINESNEVQNKITGKTMGKVTVKYLRKRWRFEFK